MNINIIKRKIKEDSSIGITVLIIVLIVLLVVVYCFNYSQMKTTQTELKKLSKEYKMSKSEFNLHTSKYDNKTNVEEIVRRDSDSKTKYGNKNNIEGIVCWGSDLTAGNTEKNISYPKMLKEKLNSDGYNIPVKNMGISGENTKTIMARSGAIKMQLRPFTIPEKRKKVYVSFQAEDGTWVFPLIKGNADITNVTIAGVNGKLYLEDNQIRSYYFIRDNKGEKIQVPYKTNLITNDSYKYKDYVPIIWIGDEYDKRSSERLIKNQQAILGNYSSDKFYILGLIDVNEKEYTQFDNAMSEKWGEHYINLKQFLMSGDIADSIGIEFSDEDNADIKNGNVPSVYFKNNILTKKGYEAVSKIIYDKISENF